MDLQEFKERFTPLAPQAKIKFMYSHLSDIGEKEKILFLLSIIRDEKSSPIVLATALKFLRQTSYQEFEIYQKYFNDRFQAVARVAKRALRDLEEKEKKNSYIVESILRKIKSVKEQQKKMKIIKGVAKLGASWVAKVLLEALSDPNEGIRDFIIRELGQREMLSLRLVYQKLVNQPWYVKSGALKILGRRKNPDAVQHIEGLLDDPNVDVRKSVAQALGEIGGTEALGLLVRLTKDKNHYVRIAAEHALRNSINLKFS